MGMDHGQLSNFRSSSCLLRQVSDLQIAAALPSLLPTVQEATRSASRLANALNMDSAGRGYQTRHNKIDAFDLEGQLLSVCLPPHPTLDSTNHPD